MNELFGSHPTGPIERSVQIPKLASLLNSDTIVFQFER
jgi:hypothetical protein